MSDCKRVGNADLTEGGLPWCSAKEEEEVVLMRS
jgi:hypothetical protein